MDYLANFILFVLKIKCPVSINSPKNHSNTPLEGGLCNFGHITMAPGMQTSARLRELLYENRPSMLPEYNFRQRNDSIILCKSKYVIL